MNIFYILSGTPVWVYVIFVYLVIIGVKASRSHDIELTRLALAPLIFGIWSLYSFHAKYGLTPTIGGLWALAGFVGALVGRMLFGRATVTNKKDGIVQFPGSWYPLVLNLLFFTLKYALGASYAIMPELRTHAVLWMTDAIASGLMSGLYAGRFWQSLVLTKRA